MHMKSIFIAEAAIKNKKYMKEICYDITPILGSSGGYREKRSHNRMIGSHKAWKHIALKYI